MRPIPYSRQKITESDIDAVTAVLRSDIVTRGEKVSEFESQIASYCDAKHAVAVSNGTAALHLATLALEMDESSQGYTSAISFVASANAFRYCGSPVKFCDVDPKTALIEPETLEATLDSASGSDALITVSFAGDAHNQPKYHQIASTKGIRAIEDAAHSLGATYDANGEVYKSASCAHSDLATLSFHPVKHICSGEGGMVTTNDSDLAKRLRILRNHGIHRSQDQLDIEDGLKGPWLYQQETLGFNYWMTDFQAALGLAQLNRIDSILAERRQIAKSYCSVFAEPPFSDHFEISPYSSQHAYHLYIIHWKNPENRASAYHYLKEQGIYTQVHYLPIYNQPYYSELGPKIPLPGAEQYYAGCLSLPIYPGLEESQLSYVVDTLKSFCKDHAKTGSA